MNIVNNNLKANCSAKNAITFKTEVLKSSICDYNDAYILVRGDGTVTAAGATQVAFKNCVPFTKCITKTEGTIIDDAENLELLKVYHFILKIKRLILTANTNDFKSF